MHCFRNYLKISIQNTLFPASDPGTNQGFLGSPPQKGGEKCPNALNIPTNTEGMRWSRVCREGLPKRTSRLHGRSREGHYFPMREHRKRAGRRAGKLGKQRM